MGSGVPEARRQCYNSPRNSDLSGRTRTTSRAKMPFLGRTLCRGPTIIDNKYLCIQECETYLSCKHLDLTESEKNKGSFWPHFVEWSKSVSIGTLCFFHFCLTPQFLSVKVEFQAARVLASKRLSIHPWKQGIRSKSTRHDQVPGLKLYAEGTRVG